MHPTDTARTLFVYKSRRPNGNISGPPLQAPPNQAGQFSPGGILLLNFEPSYAERLALVLRPLGLKKIVIPSIPLSRLRDEYFLCADFILFDLTRLNHNEVWLPLRRVCRLRKPYGMPLFVHCFSRIDRGGDFHLMVEKLGARMDYYAQ
jgi:hypothetical protein